MAEPTNSDIMERIGALDQRIQDVDATSRAERAKIYEQAKLTNGRVTKLERWVNDFQIRQDERKKLRKEARDAKQDEIAPLIPWYEVPEVKRLLILLAGLIVAATAYIQLRGGL